MRRRRGERGRQREDPSILPDILGRVPALRHGTSPVRRFFPSNKILHLIPDHVNPFPCGKLWGKLPLRDGIMPDYSKDRIARSAILPYPI